MLGLCHKCFSSCTELLVKRGNIICKKCVQKELLKAIIRVD